MPSFDPSRFINTNPVDEQVVAYEPKHKFGDFGLEPRLVRTLSEINLQTPSPIQDQIIPLILEGRDVVGIAETGTGKTAAFLLPLIHKTLKDYKRQTLILTPTRELAVQIEAELIKLSRGFRLYSTVCIGGTNIRAQVHKLRKQNHFIIATPGRLMDLYERRDFNPAGVTTVVLDEADRMLDMGFIDPIREILGSLRPDRETLFFSATIDARTQGLVSEFLKNPVVISVKKKEVTNSIKQDVVPHGHHDKFETLTNLLKGPTFKRVMIFGAMKHSVEKLAKELSQHGIPSESIHGNKSHPQRQRALTSFKAGKVRVLVATDVAARGIHVDNVSHVINYDLPNTFEDYVHRIGRTGRGNERGEALTFIHSK
jgi:ATP-dependent RNA helicase RhlE